MEIVRVIVNRAIAVMGMQVEALEAGDGVTAQATGVEGYTPITQAESDMVVSAWLAEHPRSLDKHHARVHAQERGNTPMTRITIDDVKQLFAGVWYVVGFVVAVVWAGIIVVV